MAADVESAVRETLEFLNLTAKPEQLGVIHNLMVGKHAYCVLPTGFGKSACFYVPPLALNKVSFDR